MCMELFLHAILYSIIYYTFLPCYYNYPTTYFFLLFFLECDKHDDKAPQSTDTIGALPSILGLKHANLKQLSCDLWHICSFFFFLQAD